MERVADLLRNKQTQFNNIGPTRSIMDALYQMHCENVDHLIIMDDEKFLGVLTEHDISDKLLYRSKELDIVTVKEFMSTYLPVATPGDSLEYCMQLMEKYNVRHLIVYDEFTFVGVIGSHDLMKQAISKRNAIFDEVVENKWDWG